MRTITASSLTDFPAVRFPERLVTLRKSKGFTQQALADAIGIHLSQLKRYEAGTSQPTLGALVNLAKVLSVSADALLFDAGERGPSDDLRLQFEAVSQFTPEEKKVAKAVIEGLILKHDAQRFVRTEEVR
jgi:transcriptional regulator with XRE-family HTH domain